MNYLTYVLPNNPLSGWIVAAMGIIFGLWFASWLRSLHRLSIYRRRIQKFAAATQELGARQRPEDDEQPDLQASFEQFLDEQRVPKSDPIARHVGAIFTIGASEGRLDVGELLRHTEGELARDEAPRRYILGLFIIFGLLGTMLGLADSLSEISNRGAPAGFEAAQAANGWSGVSAAREKLDKVISGLKSAFAPSICGVLLSIATTLLAAAHQRYAIGPTQALLRHATLTHWAPRLYPALGETARENMERSFKAAREVVDFARKVRGTSGAIRASMKRTARVARSVEQTTASSAAKATAMEAQLSERTAEMLVQTTKAVQAIERWTHTDSEFRASHRRLEEQQQRQIDVLDQVKGFVAELASAQGAHLEGLKQFIAVLNNDQHAQAAQFGSLLEAWRESIVSHVDKRTDETTAQLIEFRRVVSSLRAPFDNAAEKVTNAAVGFQTFAESMVRPASDSPGVSPVIPTLFNNHALAQQSLERTMRELTEELRQSRQLRQRSMLTDVRTWLEG